MKVRITAENNGFDTKVIVNGDDITQSWLISAIDLRIRPADEVPTLTLEVQPDDIEYEGEARIICHYIDPVTGERFTRDATNPGQATP